MPSVTLAKHIFLFFGIFEEKPTGNYMEMILSAKSDISPACPEKLITCSVPCKPARNKALRQSTITKYFVESSMPKEKEMKKHCGGSIIAWDPFGDPSNRCSPNIDNWGQMIYRESLKRHHKLK